MPRLVNSVTGVVVNVDDDTAARMNTEWEQERKAPAKKAASKSSKSE